MAVYKAVDTEQLDAGLTAIADALRARSGRTALLAFPDAMAAEANAVYEAGRKNVFETMTGINFFFMDGCNRALYDTFLGADLSAVASARYAFRGSTWLTAFTRPATLAPADIAGMFQGCTALTKVSGLSALPFSDGTDLFSGCTALANAGSLDLSQASDMTAAFQDCTALTAVTVTGPVSTGIDLRWSPLSGASIESVVGALSETASGLTAVFSLAAVNTAFETAAGSADGAASEEWLALAASRPGWTISLV